MRSPKPLSWYAELARLPSVSSLLVERLIALFAPFPDVKHLYFHHGELTSRDPPALSAAANTHPNVSPVA